MTTRWITTVISELFVTVSILSQTDVSPDIERIRGNFHMPGMSALAVKNGQIIAQGAAGFRREGQATKLLVTDRINIGSCTKWMTATVAARLVDQGKIAWNTRVRDVFTNYTTFNDVYHDVTLDQLLSHQGGIEDSPTFNARRGSEFVQQKGNLSQIRRWVSETVMKDPPVSLGTYANQGYAVAGTMLEIAASKDWETLMEQDIFLPARMSSASFGIVYDNALPPTAPVGHSLGVGATNPVNYAAIDATSDRLIQAAYGPGGDVISTLQDWAKFLHLQVTSDESDYLTSSSAAKIQQAYAGVEGYGRGVVAGMTRGWASPGFALSHSGSIFGHNTVFWIAPARDFVAVIFTNCQSDDGASANAMDQVAAMLVTRFSGSTPSGPFLELPAARRSSLSGGSFGFSYFTLPGVYYRIEGSADMKKWAPIEEFARKAASLESQWQEFTSLPFRFYRPRPVM